MADFAVPSLLDEPRCVWNAGALLGEGTCWSVREQSLYWVDILGYRLLRFTPATGEERSWDFDQTISAVAERAAQPGLIVTLRRSFALFDPATGALQHVHELDASEPRTNRFNDGKCDAQGRLWAGTMDFDCTLPTGALYCYSTPESSAAGSCVRVLDAGFAVTNGPTWSKDGRTMYFTDTVRRNIDAYDFDPVVGTLANARPWLRFARHDGRPDGMTTDAAGRIWIAHWGAACVSCHEPLAGAELMRIDLPTQHITNVAFGGPDLATLYITSARTDLNQTQLLEQPFAGGLFAVQTDAIGQAANLLQVSVECLKPTSSLRACATR